MDDDISAHEIVHAEAKALANQKEAVKDNAGSMNRMSKKLSNMLMYAFGIVPRMRQFISSF